MKNKVETIIELSKARNKNIIDLVTKANKRFFIVLKDEYIDQAIEIASRFEYKLINEDGSFKENVVLNSNINSWSEEDKTLIEEAFKPFNLKRLESDNNSFDLEVNNED